MFLHVEIPWTILIRFSVFKFMPQIRVKLIQKCRKCIFFIVEYLCAICDLSELCWLHSINLFGHVLIHPFVRIWRVVHERINWLRKFNWLRTARTWVCLNHSLTRGVHIRPAVVRFEVWKETNSMLQMLCQSFQVVFGSFQVLSWKRESSVCKKYVFIVDCAILCMLVNYVECQCVILG